MKKQILRLLLIASLTVALALSAGAAEPGTIRNDCPGTVEAQARMLKALGLFKGTDKGFELEKPMTRAEAAVMLTRLLGAEAEAKTQDNPHPFTDVPAWASPYVGWLYANGLTKGVSGKAYGSQRSVTCQQFGVFLTRATYNPEKREEFIASWRKSAAQTGLPDPFEQNQITTPEETAACDKAGFLRADAAAMSVRLLSAPYNAGMRENGWADRDTEIRDGSVAYQLIRRGVFTREALRKAAQGVLDACYIAATENGGWSENESDYTLACVIAEVPVLRITDPSYRYLYDEDKTGRHYAQRYNADGTAGLYLVDGDTLDLTALDTGEISQGFSPIASYGSDDYFFVEGEPFGVLKVNGTKAERLDISLATTFRAEHGGGWILDAWGGVCILDKDGLHFLPDPTESSRVNLNLDMENFYVLEDQTVERTLFSVLDKRGTVLGSDTVENDSAGALHVENVKNNALWGGVGYYQIADGKLSRRVARPVYDFGTIWADNSMVVITHAPGVRCSYAVGRGASERPTGNQLMRVAPDGTETLLLGPSASVGDGPFGALVLGRVLEASEGRIQFTALVPTEPFMSGSFTCVLENGRITVTAQTGDIDIMCGEDASQKMEQWLNSLL